MRCDAYRPPREGLKCKMCKDGEPTYDHIIWECEYTRTLNEQFMQEIRGYSEQNHEHISKLLENHKEGATKYILGGGYKESSKTEWKYIQPIMVRYISELQKSIGKICEQ
jgi:hypothetical protein